MKPIQCLRRPALILLLGLTALAGACGDKVLDFRNAEIVNGKVYVRDANTPFTGKVTNLPVDKLPLAGLGPLITLVARVTNDESYGHLFFFNAVAAAMGARREDGVVCDARITQGLADGLASCGVRGESVMRFAFKQGALEGPVELLDPKGGGKLLAQASAARGKLNGLSTIHDIGEKKLRYTVGWTEGAANGLEELRYASGGLATKANIVNGRYDGELVRYDEAGKVTLTTVYRKGEFVKNLRPGLSDFDNCIQDLADEHQRLHGDNLPEYERQRWQAVCRAKLGMAPVAPAEPGAQAQEGQVCVAAWMAAHRKAVGPEAPIIHDQVQEWEQWCREGKTPT